MLHFSVYSVLLDSRSTQWYKQEGTIRSGSFVEILKDFFNRKIYFKFMENALNAVKVLLECFIFVKCYKNVFETKKMF